MILLKLCPWCQQEFKTENPAQVYCEPKHQKYASAKRGVERQWAARGWPVKRLELFESVKEQALTREERERVLTEDSTLEELTFRGVSSKKLPGERKRKRRVTGIIYQEKFTAREMGWGIEDDVRLAGLVQP